MLTPKYLVRLIIELFIAAMLVVTSADLIYLYSIGYWHDPIRLIEITELFLLSLFIVVGLVYILWRFRNERR